jgi:hypothetical protein
VGFVKGLAKLVVVGEQGIVLLQKLSDLDLGCSHEMINGLALIALARQGEAAVIRMGVNCWGHIHAGSLYAKVPSPRVISG